VGETIGRAAELTHGAFLAHDDVIDEAPKRRGRKSLNVRTSNLEAVLAGDALLSRVMVEISGLGHVEIVKSLSEAVEETVDGEWLQLEARGERNITKNHFQIVAIKKTSSLIQWCLKAPAQKVFSGSNENAKLIYQLDNLGKRLGLAFQMVDDLVDFSASSQKPYSQDLREGLINQVTWHLMDIWPELKDPISRLLGKPELDSLPWEKKQLSWAMEKVKQEAYAHCEEAKHSIGIIEQELSPLSENQKQTIQCFYELIQWIVQREH
jgi:geranylgeranyl pyrophosphate synthase